MEGQGSVAQQALTTFFAASNFGYIEGQGIANPTSTDDHLFCF
jgi:hypothetical protein